MQIKGINMLILFILSDYIFISFYAFITERIKSKLHSKLTES